MGVIRRQIQYQSGATEYNFNILLTESVKDWGFFDTLDNDTEMVGEIDYADRPGTYAFNQPYVNSYNFSNYTPDDFAPAFTYTVTGASFSRLNELEKYVVSTDPNVKYFGGGSPTVDAVSSFTINPSLTAFTYYIGGIQYNDLTVSGSSATTTTFSFTTVTNDPLNFDNKRIIKFENKQNMVENPQVGKDVFIVRQQQPVFERNYRLRAVNGLNDTLTYAGGNYFKIFNNT